MRWRIGCSGFSYREWKEVFYPPKLPQRRWFEYYTSRFSTFEINASFYRFPQLKMLQNWYDQSPPDFIFSVKAPQSITHYKQFHDCRLLLNDLYAVCTNGLKEKLGAILFQFPPRYNYTQEKLDRILANLDTAYSNVLEFRHASWWNPDVFAALKRSNVTFCGSSISGLPDDPVITARVAYYRFHGIPDLYRSVYEEIELRKVADIFTRRRDIDEVYCYFNNTAGIGAVSNAAWLEKYISEITGVPLPDRQTLPGLFK